MTKAIFNFMGEFLDNLMKPGQRYCFRFFCCVILCAFSINVLGEDIARAVSVTGPSYAVMLPPGTLMPESQAFSLPTLKAISINPNDPFKIDFVLDSAVDNQNKKPDQEQINLLIKYFLSFLTIPEADLWVNLSPYEKNRVITKDFETTNAGRDMLVQDYTLKQLASSLTYPEHEPGKTFWKKVFDRARVVYGSTNIPINSFNKVWVVPDKTVVYEGKGSAFIAESRLKVLLEQDFLSIKKNRHNSNFYSSKDQKADYLSAQISREVIIPELEREVNEGKYFAPLRQMYNSLVLAIWFKKRVQENLINLVYVNQKKTSGIVLNEKQVKEKIYAQYLKAFQKGVYNYIKEESDPVTQEIIPRKYFSGGFSFADAAMHVEILPVEQGKIGLRNQIRGLGKRLSRFTVVLKSLGMNNRTLVSLMAAGSLFMSVGINHANAQTNFSPSTASQVYGVYSPEARSLQQLQTALNKVEWQVTSILGGQPNTVGYGRLKRVIDAIDGLPAGSQIKAQAQELRQALLDPEFFKNNLEERNSFNPKGHTIHAETQVRLRVEHAIKDLKKEVKRELSLTVTPLPTVVTAPEVATPPAVQTPVPTPEVTTPPAVQTPVPTPEVATPPAVQTPVPTPEVATPPAVQTPVPTPEVATPPAVQTPVPTPEVATLPAVQILAPTTGVNVPPTTVINFPLTTVTNVPPVIGTNVLASAGGQVMITNTGAYNISINANLVPVENILPTEKEGFLTGFDSDKQGYKQGDTIGFAIDLKLNGQIAALNDDLVFYTDTLAQVKGLFDKHAASQEELIQAQDKLNDIKTQLVQAYEEAAPGKIVAPCDLEVKGTPAISNGMRIAKGQKIFEYYSQNQERLNFSVPPLVNFFGNVSNLTINGEPVSGITSIDFGPDSSGKLAQMSWLLDLPSSGQPQQVNVTASIFPPQNIDTNLNFVTGQAQSHSSISQLHQYEIRTPVNGLVQPLVHDGQKVVQGDILAQVANEQYVQEYESITSQLIGVNTQLRHAVDTNGVFLITRDQLDGLKAQRAGLLSNLAALKQQFHLMKIRAPHDGVISGLGVYEPQGFHQAGDEIFKLNAGTATVGDINGDSLLFSQGLNINAGDPLVFQTTQGIFLAGLVTAVSPNLYSQARDFNGQQVYVSAEVFDQQNILQKDQPLNVILPRADEKKRVMEYILAIQKSNSRQQVSGGGPPPEDLEMANLVKGFNLNNAYQQPMATNIFGMPAVLPSTGTNAGRLSLNLTQTRQLTGQNELVIGADTINVLESQKEERLVNVNKLSAILGVDFQGGKLKFYGGAVGAAGELSGKVLAGEGISAGITEAWQISGNIIKAIKGTPQKERALQVKMTEIAHHHMEADKYGQMNNADNLLINIAAAEEKIRILEKLVADLQKSKSAIDARLASGMSIEADSLSAGQNLNTVQQQIHDLQGKVDNWTVALNAYIDQSNTNLNRAIDAYVPWNAGFDPINANTNQILHHVLIATNSPNPQMQQAWAASQAVDMTVRLQKIDLLPSLNMAGVYLDDGTGYSPLYSISPENLLRTSAVEQGANGVGQFELPIFDPTLKIKKDVMALEKDKDRINLESTQSHLTQKLDDTVNTINTTSQQIGQMKKAYQQALYQWQLKAGHPELYRPDQWDNEEQQVVKLSGDLIDLEAQYLKAKDVLFAMGLWSQENYYKTHAVEFEAVGMVPTIVSNAVSYGLTGGYGSQPFFAASTIPQAPTSLAVGEVHYHFTSPASGWAFMHGVSSGTDTNALLALEDTLTSDGSPINRMDALNEFLTRYQNNPAFLPALRDVLLSSTNEDITRGLLDHLVAGQDHGIRFLVGMINEAELDNNQLLVHFGFQALSDAFAMDTNSMVQMAGMDFTDPNPLFPHLTPETANKVLVTYLGIQKDGDQGRERLLKSGFWNTRELAGIYTNLVTFQQGLPAGSSLAPKAQELSSLIYDNMVRKIILSDISEVFGQGFGENSTLSWPLRQYQMIGADAEASYDYLNSPNWRHMQGIISPPLYKNAISVAQTDINESVPSLSSPMYDLPSIGTVDELTYFKSLGNDARMQYLKDLKNTAELNRTVEVPGDHRGFVVDQLMKSKDAQDHFLLMQTYLDTLDPELSSLIASKLSNEYQSTLKTDIAAAQDPAAKRIVQGTFGKLYDIDHDEQWAKLRTRSLGALDLYQQHLSGTNNLGNLAIQERAALIAMSIYEKKEHNFPSYVAGEEKEYASVRDAIDDVRADFIKYNDPRKLIKDIDERANNSLDPNVRTAFRDIKGSQIKIAKQLSINDQKILPFPSLALVGVALVSSVFIAGYFIMRAFNRMKALGMKPNQLLGMVYKKTVNGDQDPYDGAMLAETQRIIPAPYNVYNATEEKLMQWHDLISKWSQEKDLNSGRVFRDLNIILHNAADTVGDMPFTEDLVLNGPTNIKNDQYEKTFAYFSVLAINTLMELGRHEEIKNFTPNQKLNLQRDICAMFNYIDYSERYSRILSYLGCIEKVMGYKFRKGKKAEMAYPFIRWYLMYGNLWKTSRKRFLGEINDLFSGGNSLIDGLYPKGQGALNIVKESTKRIERMVKDVKVRYEPLSPNQRNELKIRSFYGRFLAGVGAIPVLSAFLGWYFRVEWLEDLGGISFLGTSVLILNFWNFIKTHLSVLEMQKKFETSILIGKVKKDLKKQFGFDLSSPPELSDANSIRLAQQDAEEKRAAEINGQSDFDMIFLVPQQKENVAQLGAYISADHLKDKNDSSKVFNDTVPVFVTHEQTQGSGNAELDTIIEAKNKFQELQAAGKYPGKSWEDLRVLFVFHGTEVSSLGRDVAESYLRWGIVTGYRAARGSNGEYKKGHIIVNTRDANFGPMPIFPKSGVLLVTAKVNEDGLKSGSFVDAPMTRHGIIMQYKIKQIGPDGLRILQELSSDNNKIVKVINGKEVRLISDLEPEDLVKIKTIAGSYYEKILAILQESLNYRNEVIMIEDEVNVQAVKSEGSSTEGELLGVLKNRYNPNNPNQKQYSRSGGVTFVGSDTVAVLTQIAENPVIRNPLRRFNLRFLYDIIDPLAIGNTNDSAKTREKLALLARKRAMKENKKDKQDALDAFYGELDRLRQQVPSGVAVESFQPYSEKLISLAGSPQEISKQAQDYRDTVMVHDAAMLRTNHQGGIDWTSAEDNMQVRKAKDNLPSAFSPVSLGQVLPTLKSFKGFDFQVIQYRPVSNPVELFLGSSVGHSGSWFSSV